MQKIFVLDTNILLNDPNSIFKFQENEVVIPITCIQEIDKFKREQTERGRNARTVGRYLDHIRRESITTLAEGVKTEKGGIIRVELGLDALKEYPHQNGEVTNDDRILAVALATKKMCNSRPVVFLTRDTNLRIRADAIGLIAQDYISDHTNIEELYSGIKELSVSEKVIAELYEAGEIPVPDDSYYSNEFVLFRNESDPSHTGLGKVSKTATHIQVIRLKGNDVWGIKPRNLEQKIALSLLMDDSIQLVTLVGRAGTGKTLLSLAAGLSKSLDESVYHKLLVARPVFPMGRDIGFLPGEIKDKLKPWMQPIFDNLEMLLHSDDSDQEPQYRASAYDLIEQNMLEIEPLTYIRGRSIPNQFFVVDESQNLTPHEIKTIITRAGNGTKIVLTGDPYQIDNPYLDSESTGLTHVVERFKSSALAGHITLTKGERSPLAQLAADIL
ncbi:PhoH family protein [bacterium]|nr:PhoH family protein [candidate division CSSED10-310 bacterium]